jgi:antitoxin ChpS
MNRTRKTMTMNSRAGGLITKPLTYLARRRYSATELLKGEEHVAELNSETAWARDGDPVGRELI